MRTAALATKKPTIARAKTTRAAQMATNGQPAADKAAELVAHAHEAGLHYVSTDRPGIARRPSGKGFTYWDQQSGKRITNADTLERIRKLVLPPAWRDVWICADPRGHLQAVGVDARGRKQYRYHEDFRRVRDENKYGRMLDFVRVLPKIRRRIKADLKLPGMPREKVLAAVVQLLESTQIRVGNDEYARTNKSFGLTTLRNKHALVVGSRVQFQFKGKSGVMHAVDLQDKRLAQIVRACQDLPGEELFTYVDEAGNPRDVGSADVNAYLREITGADFTAKDFRTWAGTVIATEALQRATAAEAAEELSATARKKQLVAAIDEVASQLRNTRAVCRKCYIHPAVLETYLEGTFQSSLTTTVKLKRFSARGLRVNELAVVTLVHTFTQRSTTTSSNAA
jgi:DNA topoisomerase-1